MRKSYLLLQFCPCLSVAVVTSECVFCQAGLNGGITWASVRAQWEEAGRAAWLPPGQLSGLLEFYALQPGWVRSRWVFRMEALAVVITTHWLVWSLCHILWESHWGSEDLDLGWCWRSHGNPNICQNQQQENSTAGKRPASTACLKLQ